MNTTRQFEQRQRRCGAPWLLTFIMAFVTAGFSAAAQDYTYSTNGGSVTITRYTGPGGEVQIPSEIDGLPVVSIGEVAFGFSYGINRVTMPDSVTNIGQLAFLSCAGLTNILLSSGVMHIGELAFKNCVNLAAIEVKTDNPFFSAAEGVLFNKNQTALVQYPPGKPGGGYCVPASVQLIGNGAFYGCAELSNVVLPAALKNIGATAFYGCVNLDGLTFPVGVTNIGAQAFLNCQTLSEVILPDSVVGAGPQGFSYCTALTNVVLGDGLLAIGDNMFTSCSNLLSVTGGEGVTTIGNSAFAFCFTLSTLNLGRSLTNIDDSAFIYCFNLPALDVPEGVISIASHAFQYCSGLETVILPATLANFGDRVFEFCSRLSFISVNAANPVYQDVNGVLFDRRTARLIQYPVANARTDYTIPLGTRTVGNTAFVSAFNLLSVTIPASVTNIETLGFYDCSDVTGFFFQGNPPALGDNVFELDEAATVYYLPGEGGWPATFGGLPTAMWDPKVLSVPANPAPKTFGFTITGATNLPVVIEASPDLGANDWCVIGTVVLTNGTCYFSDLQAAEHSRRYYRIRSP